MININLFGGPGTGKSTTAAGLFHEMKKEGVKVEYITEYAKDLVFSNDFWRLKDQVYILAKQHHPLFKMESQVDFLINDGPFIIGLLYLQETEHLPKKEFTDLVVKMFKSYEHINIFLERDVEEHGYQEYGREQTLAQAEEIDKRTKRLLDEHGIKYTTVKIGKNSVHDILKNVIRSLGD